MSVFLADTDDLLLGLQNKDEGAFNDVFLALYPRLCLFAEKFVQDKEDSEDIVEDVFLKLWDNPMLFNDSDHLKAYLFRSIRNSCLNLLKANQRSFDRNNFFSQEQGEIDETSYLSEITHIEVMAELYAAIAQLPPQAQRVITKTYIEGMSNQEVADELALSINTVKNHKQNALAILRSKLSNDSYFMLFILSSFHLIDKIK